MSFKISGHLLKRDIKFAAINLYASIRINPRLKTTYLPLIYADFCGFSAGSSDYKPKPTLSLNFLRVFRWKFLYDSDIFVFVRQNQI